MTTSGLAVPGWGGVATSLLLVAVAAAVAYRQRLRLTRDIVVAAARAGLQLIAAGAILLVLFRWAGLPGAAGWVTAMILIAGQVAGRRGMGCPVPGLLRPSASPPAPPSRSSPCWLVA